jgi:uncharacterized damage-inducible protein DinB
MTGSRLVRAGRDAAIAGRREVLNDWIIDWAKAESEASLAEALSFTFVNGSNAVMQRGEMFLHLVTHATYHRGWVAEMFFESGARPPETDLSVFLCDTPQDWRRADYGAGLIE